MKIIYTGAIADLYQGKLGYILLEHGFDFMRSRVDRGKECSRPIIVIDTAARTAWIEYVSEDISEYDNEDVIYTCSPAEVEETINNIEEYDYVHPKRQKYDRKKTV